MKKVDNDLACLLPPVSPAAHGMTSFELDLSDEMQVKRLGSLIFELNCASHAAEAHAYRLAALASVEDGGDHLSELLILSLRPLLLRPYFMRVKHIQCI